MCLCENCNRTLGSKMCTIPNEDGTLFTWSNQREVLNSDGSCDYHDPKTWKDELKTRIKRPYYMISNRFDMIRDFFKYRVIKRAKYGFDIRDTWSLGSVTAQFLAPRLRHFIDNKPMGVPGVLMDRTYVEDNNLSQYFDGELQDEWFGHDSSVDEPMKAWIAILEKIYFSMDYVSNEWDDKYNYMIKNEYGESNIDRDKYAELTANSNEGLRLLGIFFVNLWD